MKLEEFLASLRVAARESGIVKREESLSLGPTKAEIRFHLEDESYIDVFVNAVMDKRYFHWQRVDGKIYRVNNFPPEGGMCMWITMM